LAELPRRDFVRWLVGRDLDQQFPPRKARRGATRLAVANLSVPDPDGGPRLAVADVSFTAAAGEIMGFAGLQGSGCSELFHALFGSYGPLKDGTVNLDGEGFDIVSPARSRSAGLALLTNDRKANGLVLGMSCLGNITLAALKRYSPGGWLRPGAERVAGQARRKELGIRLSSLDQPVGELSGGNQQKIVLVKWLETRPRVLLLDEPTRGVDVGAKHEIYELINRLTYEGITILLITSELPELLALSDRIVVLCRGQMAATLDRDEATQEAVTQAAMGG
jgi:ABC-type sugar transport system ATPase subunit